MSLGEQLRRGAGVFEDAYNYMKSGTLLRQVVNRVNRMDFNRSSDRHQFGDISEQILRDLQSAGNSGEHYTAAPTHPPPGPGPAWRATR